MRYVWTILLVAAVGGCTQVSITGNGNTVTTSTMVNGNSATIPVQGLPGLP
jgi:hypothetical protein